MMAARIPPNYRVADDFIHLYGQLIDIRSYLRGDSEEPPLLYPPMGIQLRLPDGMQIGIRWLNEHHESFSQIETFYRSYGESEDTPETHQELVGAIAACRRMYATLANALANRPKP